MCWEATRCGYLHILKYLHENGCPLRAGNVKEAIRTHQFKCLYYLVKNGCPLMSSEDRTELKIISRYYTSVLLIGCIIGTAGAHIISNTCNYILGFKLFPLIRLI